jgi:DNA-binding NarL/FixJ family response regulator
VARDSSRSHGATVDDIVGWLSRGEGRTVLVTGLPGIGKSTTAGLVAGKLARSGTAVRRVESDGMSRSRPFGLIAGLLGVEATYPPQPDTADRMVQAVEKLCAEGPVLLCADDLHQADGDSLGLLGWLADMTRDLPLSLLLTRRPLPVRDGLAVLAARPDVHRVELAGLAPDELDALVTARYGAPPGPPVVRLLGMTGGNPFHAQVLLDDLQRRGFLESRDGMLTTSATDADASESVQAGARTHLALLDAPARNLLQVLAVWGQPAEPAQLAEVTGSKPASLLGAIQTTLASGVARWTDDDRLAFQHDLFRDVVYSDLDPPLRKMLHAACAAELQASGEISSQVLQQSGAAHDPSEPENALRVVATDLAHAPAQAADLLATAADQAAALPLGPDRTRLEDRIAVVRTGVLAEAGHMAEAMQVADEGLDRTTDPAVRAELVRIRLHHIVSTADIPSAVDEIDRQLAGELPAASREALTQLRRWSLLLDGRTPIGDGVPTGRSGAALLPGAMDLFLAGRCREALRMLEQAVQARERAGSPEWADGPSAPALVAWFALHAEGVESARKRSVEARRVAQEHGHGWQLPLHLYNAAAIDYVAGRWDDALAIVDTGLEASAVTQSGFVSRAFGLAAAIRIRRGELDDAALGLERWRLRALPEQYGLPVAGLSEMLLDEARSGPVAAREAAQRTWKAALDTGRVVWVVNAGPDTARVALRAGDTPLLSRIAADSAAAPASAMPGMAPAVDLIQAIAERDPDRAMAAASAYAGRGHVLGELGAWEEAAVAAAARGDAERARSCAARCTNVAAMLGANAVARRLTARLREHEIRLGATGRRRRPSTGWDSLTPTELQVAELVGHGLTSPQIAARLYLSPRTVQTHISHSLRKLGLSSRVELATTVARHR